MKTIAKTYNIVQDNSAKLAWTLIMLCAFMAMVYGFNIFKMIKSTVALESLNGQTATLGNEVDSLDSDYLKLTGSITPDELASYGFTQGKVSQYISKSTSLSLAIGGHEL